MRRGETPRARGRAGPRLPLAAFLALAGVKAGARGGKGQGRPWEGRREGARERLAHIAGVTQPFFQAIDGLPRNGVSDDRIVTALKDGGIDLPMLVDCARSLNRINAHRPLQFDAAARIADRLVADQARAVCRATD